MQTSYTLDTRCDGKSTPSCEPSAPMHRTEEGQAGDTTSRLPGGTIEDASRASAAPLDPDTSTARETAGHTSGSPNGEVQPKPLPPIRYLELSVLPSSPKSNQRQRKPGMTRPPSYTASPINSPFASPPNVGRKRANAISLANSPARRSHSENMARIFEQSRRTVRFHEETRKKSAEEKRRHVSAAECRRPEQDVMQDMDQPRLPALAPVGRLSDDFADDLFRSTETTATARLARARTLHRSLENGRTQAQPNASAAPVNPAPLSTVERWLTTLPEDPPPKPNSSHIRTPSRSTLSPQATTHRMCSSAASIAQRIALRSPPPCDFGTSTAPATSVEDHITHNEEGEESPKSRQLSVLSRLLKPPTRIPRTNASIWTHPPSRAPAQSPNPLTTQQSCEARKPRKLLRTPIGASKAEPIADDTSSTSSSTPSDSGSSSILYLPKTRSPARDPFSTHNASARKSSAQASKSTPAKPNAPSPQRKISTTCTPAPLHISKTSTQRERKDTPTKLLEGAEAHVKELTPEVSVHRKGKALRSPRKGDAPTTTETPTQVKSTSAQKQQTLRARCKSFYGKAGTSAVAWAGEDVAGDDGEEDSDKENIVPVSQTSAAGDDGAAGGAGTGEERIRRDSGCFERGQY